MNMGLRAIWVLALVLTAEGASSSYSCRPGQAFVLRLPSTPSSGFVWYSESAVPVNGVMGEYRVTGTQEFLFECPLSLGPGEVLKLEFALKCSWSVGALRREAITVESRV